MRKTLLATLALTLFSSNVVLSADRPQIKTDVLHFPSPWVRADISQTVLTQPATFETRLAGDPVKSLLIVLQDSANAYSQFFYRVDLSARRPIRTDHKEFFAARELKTVQAVPLFITNIEKRRVTYEGKSYRCSGDRFTRPAALPSPDGKILAMFSYDQNKQPSFSTTGEPSAGTIFVDFFDLRTGRKIASRSDRYKGYAPSLLVSSGRWSGNQFFTMPLDFMSQKAMLAIVRQPRSRH